ncbi:hypothetical protein NFI96_004568 [Prochilodus magdalenae]|nr:hypothetical protein NFI96_004568 [Prochilodus magdalenae]
MGELQPSALTMKPLEGVHRGMCLQLHGGAVDAIAFAESSSLSSASPDSMRSLSSLSGGRTDSPLDVEMPEGTVDRKVTTGEDDSGIQSPDYRADNDHDNSVSVYLDADEEGWCEIRDDQDNVTLVLAPKQGHGDRNHGDHGRRSSGNSSATEAGLCCSGYEEDDDDDDDAEDSFLSLSSADVVMRCPNEEGPIRSSSRVPVSELHREDLQKSVEQGPMQSPSRSPGVGLVSELHQRALHETMEIDTEECQVSSSTRGPDIDHVTEPSRDVPEESMEIHSEECQRDSPTRMGHVSELHQDASQESMELHTREGQMQSSSRRPDVGPVNELQEEALQELMQLRVEESQLQSSSRKPNVGLVNELQEEALQESMQLRVEESQMQSSSRRPDVGPVNELQEEALQESMQLCVKKSQMQSSSRRPDVGPVNELQEEALQESMQLRVEESQMQSSSRRPDVGPVNELQEEALQESMQLRVEESQMQSSARKPNVGLVNELQEEAPQESMQLGVEESQMQSSHRKPDVGPVNELQEEALQESMQLRVEESQMQSSSRRPDVGPVNELQEEALQESMQLRVEESQMQSSFRRPDVGSVNELHQEVPQYFGPHIEKTLEATLSETVLPPVSEDSLVESSAPTQDAIETNASTTTTLTVPSTNNKAKHTKDPPGQGHARPTTKPSMTKSSKTELRRFPRPDLKNVKPKVVSRAASAPRPANPSQSAAGPEKKPPPTRGRSANIKDHEGDGAIKKRRSSSNQARVTMPAPAGDPRSKATHLQPEEKPPCVNDANVSPEITVRGDQEQKHGAEVMDVVKEEAEGHEEEVPLDAEEEAPKDVDQVRTYSGSSGWLTCPFRNLCTHLFVLVRSVVPPTVGEALSFPGMRMWNRVPTL